MTMEIRPGGQVRTRKHVEGLFREEIPAGNKDTNPDAEHGDGPLREAALGDGRDTKQEEVLNG